MCKTIQMFEAAGDRVPFADWIESLPKNIQDLIVNRIDRIALGSTSNFRPVGHGVTELKIDVGPGYRVYFGQDGDTIIILLGGGDKSTQTTDIAKAIEHWGDYNA